MLHVLFSTIDTSSTVIYIQWRIQDSFNGGVLIFNRLLVSGGSAPPHITLMKIIILRVYVISRSCIQCLFKLYCK
jgi:hypothetical protein